MSEELLSKLEEEILDQFKNLDEEKIFVEISSSIKKSFFDFGHSHDFKISSRLHNLVAKGYISSHANEYSTTNDLCYTFRITGNGYETLSEHKRIINDNLVERCLLAYELSY